MDCTASVDSLHSSGKNPICVEQDLFGVGCDLSAEAVGLLRSKAEQFVAVVRWWVSGRG